MSKIIPRLLLAVAITSLAFSVQASDPGSAEADKKKSQNSRVCKKVKPTGSHIGQRVCLKKKEWDAMEEAAREKLRDSNTHSRGGGPQGR